MSAVEPYRVDGGIMAPKRAETDDGGTIGVGWVLLRPGDAEYAEWDRYLRKTQPRGVGKAWLKQR